MRNRICAACDSESTQINKNGFENWRHHDGEILCNKCYARYVWNPVYNPITNPRRTKEDIKRYYRKTGKKWDARRLWFKGKIIYLTKRVLVGKCELCGKKVGDKYINSHGRVATIRQTDTHHIDYHDDDPLKDTMELCIGCHRKESSLQRRLMNQ